MHQFSQTIKQVANLLHDNNRQLKNDLPGPNKQLYENSTNLTLTSFHHQHDR